MNTVGIDVSKVKNDRKDSLKIAKFALDFGHIVILPKNHNTKLLIQTAAKELTAGS